MKILEILIIIGLYYIFINPLLIYMMYESPMFTNIFMGMVMLLMVISLLKGLTKKIIK
tara:strand:- start:570 stop:743 length:174 start_codon:yes stop_codon:yes gene_type:complete